MKYQVVCTSCQGRGFKSKKLAKKVRVEYESALKKYHESSDILDKPMRPKANVSTCDACEGTGLQCANEVQSVNNQKFPHIAIIGAGIGGLALAVACQHRGIPFTLYERDNSKDDRAQGYGLTLQQANRSIKKLGVKKLKTGIISTRHIVHTIEGEIIGEWGGRKWKGDALDNDPKRSNMHIARRDFREALFAQLSDQSVVQWGHQLIDYSSSVTNGMQLNFIVNGEQNTNSADIVVGADGIRSTVRHLLLGDELKPLRYLGCIVILGICNLDNLSVVDTDLLDGHTIFQTADGENRIYVMPYAVDAVMWQLSCPMSEHLAKELANSGSCKLKEYACNLLQWHTPIPEIVKETDSSLITGYPVYDRDVLRNELELAGENITLIGDAAHPMSPFKGQGANQAVLDALDLAERIYTTFYYDGWGSDTAAIRSKILTPFEDDMLKRSGVKVRASADAVRVLHSSDVFEGGDQPRGGRSK